MSKIFAIVAIVTALSFGGTMVTSSATDASPIRHSYSHPILVVSDSEAATLNLLLEQYLSATPISKDPTAAIECLADNIYFEARNQSTDGMIAVGRVVINRLRDNRWPNTICGVVKDAVYTESWKTRGTPDTIDARMVPVKNKCQFSWYCDGLPDEIRDTNAYSQAKSIASDIVLHNRWDGLVSGATHYHANYVNPSWSKRIHYIGRIDSHLFYYEVASR
jgi:spore germination cell wall hydrolase CwlJ-like protein